MNWMDLEVRTPARCAFVDISARMDAHVRASGIEVGTLTMFCPHTTAALTLNEGADPDVRGDLLLLLDRLAPPLAEFRHGEGNSDAHAKASLFGASLIVPVEEGRLALGRWQALFLCEFDGPRTRTLRWRVSP